MKLIDAHTHVIERLAGYGSKGELRAIGGGRAKWANGDIITMFPAELGEKNLTGEALKELLDREGVEKAVLLQGGFYGFQNDYSLEVARKFPETFLCGFTLDPFCLHAEEILEHFLNEGLRVLKFETSTGAGLMGYHSAFDLAGPILEKLVARAASAGCTLVLDLGSPGMASFQPEAVAKIAKRHPGMNIVVCHLLAPTRSDRDALEKGLRDLKAYNIYFDISAVPWNVYPEQYPYPTARAYLKLAKELVGADHLLWGSDVPCPLTRDSYRHLWDYFRDAGIFTESELDGVYYENALRVYPFA